jgi:hypothetical protein
MRETNARTIQCGDQGDDPAWPRTKARERSVIRFEVMLRLKVLLKHGAKDDLPPFVERNRLFDLLDEIGKPLFLSFEFVQFRSGPSFIVSRVPQCDGSALQSYQMGQHSASQDYVRERHAAFDGRRSDAKVSTGCAEIVRLLHLLPNGVRYIRQIGGLAEILERPNEGGSACITCKRAKIVPDLAQPWKLFLNPLLFTTDQVEPQLSVDVFRRDVEADHRYSAAKSAPDKANPACWRQCFSPRNCYGDQGGDGCAQHECQSDKPDRAQTGEVVVFHADTLSDYGLFVETVSPTHQTDRQDTKQD